jgi:hypothetical protein
LCALVNKLLCMDGANIIIAKDSFWSRALVKKIYIFLRWLGLLNICSSCQAHFVEMDPWVISEVLEPNLRATGFLDVSVIHMKRVESFLENAEKLPGIFIYLIRFWFYMQISSKAMKFNKPVNFSKALLVHFWLN